MVNFKEDERLNTLNHSCAHVMAQAVKHLYPHAKFWVGPVVKEGFYYDIDLGDNVINDEAIEAIEKEMKKICKEGKKIYRREVSKEEALEMFKDDMYKLDLISGLEDGNITVYDQGDFTDLCRGPHVDNTKLCKNFKLVKYSGVYWKGDASNQSMVYVSQQLRSLKNILSFLRKQRNVTTERLARKWNFSCQMT
jgi:threonyl-tRNA synthetase